MLNECYKVKCLNVVAIKHMHVCTQGYQVTQVDSYGIGISQSTHMIS